MNSYAFHFLNCLLIMLKNTDLAVTQEGRVGNSRISMPSIMHYIEFQL